MPHVLQDVLWLQVATAGEAKPKHTQSLGCRVASDPGSETCQSRLPASAAASAARGLNQRFGDLLDLGSLPGEEKLQVSSYFCTATVTKERNS